MNFSNLLYWAAVFFVIAIVAAVFGFGGISGTTMEGAKLLFWAAIVIAVVTAVIGMMRRG